MGIMSIRLHVIVDGRVQGVFYRQECVRQAKARNVSGWVRNRADGTVEAVFEGEAEDVVGMVEWARIGTPAAMVEQVEATEEDAEGLSGFGVRYE